MNILNKVQKAARYTGGELNSIVKDKNTKIRFAFCFPDVYEVGMSHLGMKILYHGLNKREDTWVERVFTPWVDMQDEMKKAGIPLYGLESKDPIKDFDFVGFTLQYEMSYTNILSMLDLAGIPLLSADRGEEDTFVCMGGPCAYNPEPLADFCDFFLIGEGEEIWNEVLDVYSKWKDDGLSRFEFLKQITGIEGIYVPSFYDVSYNDDGTVKEYKPKYDFVPKTVKKRIIEDMDSVDYPEKMVVPFTEIVHDRIMLELFRGCIRGCRFCQAGFIYRPVRERSTDRLCDLACKLIDSTGYEEISLTSLSTSDYTDLENLTNRLLEITAEKKINMALPSLRVDNFSAGLMQKIQSVRKSSLTFAPEAGSQRMRDVINKNVTEEDLMRSVSIAFEGGWTSVKLYFMIGLPTETIDDVIGIAKLSESVADKYYEIKKGGKGIGRGRITTSVSSFVPKPFTPFQWERQNTIAELREKQMHIKDNIKTRMINYNYHESYVSVLEGVFSRGDRRLGKVLLNAHNLGCKFDGWDEFFDYDVWMQAFEQAGIDSAFYARKREFDEVLPWDVIDCGVTKQFFISECKKAYDEKTTPNCREKCAGCGLMGKCGVKQNG